ncbi:MAG: porin, partial [Pseudomonadota bacterium]
NNESPFHPTHYYTPNIAGFELGVSWAPGTSTDADGSPDTGDACDVDTNCDVTNSNDEIAIAGSYANSFGDVDFAIGGGYFMSDDDAGDETVSYGGGVELGFGQFLLGGAVRFREEDEGYGGEDGETWQYGAGVEYSTGPWVFGVNGFYQEIEVDAVDEDWEGYVINVAAGYELGDGVDIGLSLDYGSAEFDDDDIDDEDAFGGALLLGVSF